jgi:hypothetical protein
MLATISCSPSSIKDNKKLLGVETSRAVNAIYLVLFISDIPVSPFSAIMIAISTAFMEEDDPSIAARILENLPFSCRASMKFKRTIQD